ncbi:MAG: hypothetical protein IJW55_08130 [Clostridia bacterium]|nr:hypothetical protein [Clostridia bacterium]
MLKCKQKLLSILLCITLLVGLANFYAVPTVAATSVTPTLEIGPDFFAALDHSGTVWTWTNASSSVTSATKPTAVTATDDNGNTLTFVSVAAGTNHVLAISSQGTVYAWGSNETSQLGVAYDDTHKSTTTPWLVADLSNVTAVAAGNGVSFALCADGSVYSWGDASKGMLGLGEETQEITTPTKIEELKGVFITEIYARNSSAAAIAADGTVYLWGQNGDTQLGIQSTSVVYVPTTTTETFSAAVNGVAFGASFSTFLCADGTVQSVGINKYGQFGNGSTSTTKTYLLKAADLDVLSSNIVMLAAGSNHTLALTASGTVYGWGDGEKYQLGVEINAEGENSNLQTTPLQIDALNDIIITSIAANNNYSAAIDENGLVYLWGNDTALSLTPITKADGSNLCLGTAPEDISKDVYVTATANIPKPTYTVSIPAELGAEDLMQTSTALNKLLPFTVSASDIDYLFGEQEVVVSIRTESGEFVLENAKRTHKLYYSVYNTSDTGTGTAIENGNIFAVFTEDGEMTVNGRIEIDQSQIVYTDEYTGTIIFDIALAAVEQEEAE